MVHEYGVVGYTLLYMQEVSMTLRRKTTNFGHQMETLKVQWSGAVYVTAASVRSLSSSVETTAAHFAKLRVSAD